VRPASRSGCAGAAVARAVPSGLARSVGGKRHGRMSRAKMTVPETYGTVLLSSFSSYYFVADLSSMDKPRQEAAAAASAVQQATDQAIVAMEAWGDTQLELTAATDALSAAATS